MPNPRFRTFTLCALVLGLMAFVTSSAQAEKGAAWKVNGAAVNATLKPKLKSAIENETASLLTTILGIPVKILCKSGEITSTLGTEGSINEGKVKIAGCAIFLKESTTASAPCLPKTAGVNDVVETNALVGLLVLVGGVGETLIKPAAGAEKPLAVVESTEECAVGQKISITGEIIDKDCEGKIKEELVTHLIEADNVNSTMKAAGQKATLDGSFNVALAGEHAGLKWSGQPA